MKSIFVAVLLCGVAQVAVAGETDASSTTIPLAPPAKVVVDPAPEPAKKWPPAVQQLSPSAPLNPKAKHSMALVRKWAQRHVMPSPGPRGEVRFIFGATQDTIVCAPLQICDLALQAGEIVQKIDLGDAEEWKVEPGISGAGLAQVTHVLIKPQDAGLRTTLSIQTSRRSYSIELVSTQHDYMPKVSYSYPSDQALEWTAYQDSAGSQGGGSEIPRSDHPYVSYSISGDSPPWRPIQVWSDGRKTYIEFPPSMAYGKAPVLERLP